MYKKRQRNSALLESDHIVSWRNQYIEKMREYREDGRSVYYLYETWVNASQCSKKTWVVFLKGLSIGATNPSGKG